MVALLLFSGALGCGSGDNPLGRQAVYGEVKLNGEELHQGTIEFFPDGEGVPSGARIKDGKFEIPEEKGLPPGLYRVRVSAADDQGEPVGMPGESNKIARELIPRRYNVDSTQMFSVSADGDNAYLLDMTGT